MASSRCCKTVLVPFPSSKKDSFCPPASAHVVPCVNLQSGGWGSLPLHAVYRGTWRPIPCAPFPYLQSGLNSCLLPPVGTSRGWWKQCPRSCWSFFRKALKYKFLLAVLSYCYLQIQLEEASPLWGFSSWRIASNSHGHLDHSNWSVWSLQEKLSMFFCHFCPSHSILLV